MKTSMLNFNQTSKAVYVSFSFSLSLSLFFFHRQCTLFHSSTRTTQQEERNQPLISYRPFSSCLEPLSQSEAKCESIDMKLIFLETPVFYSHANATHFHKKGFALSLVLKTRVFGTRRRPITIRKQVWNKFSPKIAHVVSSFSYVCLFRQF